MKKISDFYKEYKIMQSLQLHQLRVAAVAMQICDSLSIEVDKKTIVIACVLHDMGNIVKFNFAHFPDFFKPEGIEYWKGIKDEFTEKYGASDHEATVGIVRELGISERIVELISQNRFNNLCLTQNGDDWALKILKYADMRVSPKGVLSYDERMEEANDRYKNNPDNVTEKERQELVSCGKKIEDQIFSVSNIKPEFEI